MWLVKGLFAPYAVSGKLVSDDKQFAYVDYRMHVWSLDIAVQESMTGEERVIHITSSEPDEIEKKMVGVYGFTVLRGTLKVEYITQVIDSLSWQFLSYVDSIEHVVEEVEVRGRGIGSQVTQVASLDSNGTLFVVHFSASRRPYFATLFNLVCYIEDGWVGDEFYLPESCSEAPIGLSSTSRSYLKVKFGNIRGARALISKVFFMQHQVLKNYVKVLKGIR